MEITTKFTIGTEQGRGILASLAKEIATEKFKSVVEPQQFEDYISKNSMTKT